MPHFLVSCLQAVWPLLACGVSPKYYPVNGEGVASFVEASGTISTHHMQMVSRRNGRSKLMRAESLEPLSVPLFNRSQHTTVTTTTYVEAGRLLSLASFTTHTPGCLDQLNQGKVYVNSVCHNGSNQKWSIASIPGGKGFFHLRNLNSSGCLDSNLYVGFCNNGHTNQKFKFEGQLIKSFNSSCLDWNSNDRGLYWNECNGVASQNFQLEREPICAWSSWGTWSACSATCAGGVRFKKRSTESVSEFGYAPCKQALGVDEEKCNMQGCGAPCQWGNWSAWGKCRKSCGGGTQVRSRQVANETVNGGVPCTGNTSEQKPCNNDRCPVDCKLAEWEKWGDCSKICGTGKSVRKRSEATSAEYGGKACNDPKSETVDCNTDACPGDCEWGDWESWTTCTKSCGNGTRSRNRTKTAIRGQLCKASSMATESCSLDGCPVDCTWGEWQGWSECSKDCGGGEQKNHRKVKQHAEFHGKACQGNGTETKACNLQACSNDCKYEAWSAWTACSVTCGKGARKRVRARQEDQNGETPCLKSSEEDVSCYGAQVDCNDPAVTLTPVSVASPPTTEVLKGSYVTGDMQLQVDDPLVFMGIHAANDAVKDAIADLGKVHKEQVEVVFNEAAHGKSMTASGIVDVSFSIRLYASLGEVGSKGSKVASILTNTKLKAATLEVEEKMQQHEVVCADNLTCNPGVIGLSAHVAEEPRTGEASQQHASKVAPRTDRSASCRRSETCRLVWTELLVIAVVANQRFQK